MNKQPNNVKGKKLVKQAARTKTNKSRARLLNTKQRRQLAKQRMVQFNWFLKHGVKENENNGTSNS